MKKFSFNDQRKNLEGAVNIMLLRWTEDPSKFEGKKTITPPEIKFIQDELMDDFFIPVVESSGLSGEDGPTDEDMCLVEEMIGKIGDAENLIITDPARRPWNASCKDHAKRVAIVAREIADQLNFNPREFFIRGLVHDIGRYASHHPWIHAAAGKDILNQLGFSSKYCQTALNHAEAGALLFGATPGNWDKLSQDFNLLAEANKVSLADAVLAIADMCQKAVEDPPGSNNFKSRFADPMEGVFTSGLRRLTQKQKELVKNIDPLCIDHWGLREVYRTEPRIGMYLGLCWLLKAKLAKQGVVFEGVIERAEEALRGEKV